MARWLIIGIAVAGIAGGAVAMARMETTPAVVAALLPQARDAGGNLLATPDDLRIRIAQAGPGDTIRLAPGAYPFTVIQRVIDGEPVKITGPRTALITGLVVNGGRGWQFSGMTILPFQKRPVIALGGARDVLFDSVLITGSAPGEGPENEETVGLQIDISEGVVITNSELTHLRIVMGLRGTRGLVVAGNRIVNSREGVNINGSRGMLFARNLFDGFRPRFDRGEHPDFIQLFTRQQPGSGQLEISGNLFSSGLDKAVQGIFIRAEDYETGQQPDGFHRDIVIRNNVYFGSSPHGIALGNTRNAIIEHNTVLPSPNAFVGHLKPPTAESSGGFAPRITVGNNSSGRITGNITTRVLASRDDPALVVRDNIEVTMRSARDARNPDGLFQYPLDAGQHPASRFALKPGSAAARRGLGADVTQVGVPPEGVDAAAMRDRARALLASTPPLPPPPPRADLGTRIINRLKREVGKLSA